MNFLFSPTEHSIPYEVHCRDGSKVVSKVERNHSRAEDAITKVGMHKRSERRVGDWKEQIQVCQRTTLCRWCIILLFIFLFSSAEYHTNNLLSAVLFEEGATNIPEDALTIEIAPHGLLQAIIKKALPNGVHIPLTQRGNKDNTSFFLAALGK